MAADMQTQPSAPAAAPEPSQPQAKANKSYKGFVAGVFSGIAKLSGSSFNPLPTIPSPALPPRKNILLT